jgi:hypothetical protein
LSKKVFGALCFANESATGPLEAVHGIHAGSRHQLLERSAAGLLTGRFVAFEHLALLA